MKYRKRILCLLLAVLLALPSVVGAAAPVVEGQVTGHGAPASMVRPLILPTQDDLTTSEAGLEFIKTHEGYSAYPYGDNSQTSIGYGCSTAFAAKYGFSTTYLSREDAHALLICVVSEFEASLDRFLTVNNLTLSQTQYDALISFTFNLGTGWLSGCRLSRALISGSYTVNQFASAMGIWCHVGTQILEGLVNRRIDEIVLFLYGAYSLSDTDKRFCTLIYDGDGTFENDIDFFLAGAPYGAFSAVTPPETGLYFTGWFTAQGMQITETTIVAENLTVYPGWSTELPVEQGCEILGLTLHNRAGTVMTDIPTGAFYAKAEVYLDKDNDSAVIVLASFSEDGQLLTAKRLQVAYSADTTDGYIAWFSNADGSIAQIKAFVLSASGSHTPLCPSAETP